MFRKPILVLLTVGTGALHAAEQPIYWETHLYSAYQEAVALHKPLVVYFYEDPCPWCSRLDSELNLPGTGASIANAAVFVRINLAHDDGSNNVHRLAKQLEITRCPTVAVLNVAPAAIIERGRVVGYFPRDEIIGRLARWVLSGSGSK